MATPRAADSPISAWLADPAGNAVIAGHRSRRNAC